MARPILLQSGSLNTVSLLTSPAHQKAEKLRLSALIRSLVLLLLAGPVALPTQANGQVSLPYAPAPIDNPLKGLVPYAGDKRHLFPHSMEFAYLPLSDLMVGPNEFRWQKLEERLDDIASRGHQTVFRIWMEYPGHEEGIPPFLTVQGVKVTTWLNTNTAPFPSRQVRTPDYEDPRLRQALQNFIAALGQRYDGDPRVGYITAGLLGTWGEWHTYPKTELMASKRVQSEVMDAYEKHFRQTPVLLRYPAGPKTWAYAANHDRRLGYHDDSFAWATLETEQEEDNWFFVPAMKSGDPGCVERWKTQPIGGEIRPELWGKIFDDNYTPHKQQTFAECVQQTHATWLMDTGIFRERQSDERIRNAQREVRRMGYEFHVVHAMLVGTRLQVQIRNTGVAPFYHDWTLRLGLVADNRLTSAVQTKQNLNHLLPGQTRSYEFALPASLRKFPGQKLAIQMPNPLQGGQPLRFANAAELQLGDGALNLQVEVPDRK